MDKTILKKNIGVHFNEDALAEIKVWAPHAKAVQVLINQDIQLSLEMKANGYWTLTTALLRENDQYQFILTNEDKKLIRADPAAISMPLGVHSPSMAFNVNKFLWTDGAWKGIPLADYIIYELHVGTFTAEGDFNHLATQLDHLIRLGVTAIELMPITQFPGERNWGYDVAFPFAVQSSYGGPLGLQQLIDTCHQKGLAVILDVVYNHIGPEGNYFTDFGPYFTHKYQTPWGDAINFDDEYCDAVREFYIENALMWLRDFHVDALRLDAVHAIKDLSAHHFLAQLQESVQELSKHTKQKYHLMIECDLNDPKYISDAEFGYGMDAQWLDEFHHSMRVASGQQRIGYYADFDGINHLAKSFKDAYVYDGVYSEERKKYFGHKVNFDEGEKFVVFSQNHDHIGNRLYGERSSTLVSANMQKLLAGVVLCSPFLPLLFMGEEWGETNPFLYFISHSDQKLIEAVRAGRRNEFKAFHVGNSMPDPQDPITFEKSKLQWSLLNQQKHSELFNYYCNLIALRKHNAALHQLNKSKLTTYPFPDEKALIIHRWHGEQHCLCFFNFSDQPQRVSIPETKFYWKQLLDSTAVERSNTDGMNSIQPTDTHIILKAESLQIYSNKYASS